MALFAEVAGLAEELAGEASRLKKRAAIAETLKRIVAKPMSESPGPSTSSGQAMGHPDLRDVGLFCLYLAGQAFAEADPRKLNAGGALLSRVVKEVSGCTDAQLAAAYRRHGDLGAAAFDLLKMKQGLGIREQGLGSLTLVEVATVFDAMAGARTTAARAAMVEDLLRRASALEVKYLLKLMLGDMRIGVKQSLIEEAIAGAAEADIEAVRNAVMLEADLARTVEMVFAGTLGQARMRLFHPLGFMLASPVETPEEAVERFTEKPDKAKVGRASKRKSSVGNVDAPEAVLAVDAAEDGYAEDVVAAAREADSSAALRNNKLDRLEADGAGAAIQAFLEDKYDGMRAQVHCGDAEQPGRVAIYSRNREAITQSFPEIEEAFRGVSVAGVGPLILDGELLGWDFAESRALPFAVLGQRIGRKRVSNEMRRQIPVVFMAFDLLFEDGELLLARPLRERRARLEAVVERLRDVAVAGMEEAAPVKAQAGLFDDGVDSVPPRSENPNMGHPSNGRETVRRLMLSPAVVVESAEAIDRAYAEARARANEGVMLKAAGSVYLPGRRGLAWVKLKRELATLDVVITGAEFGHGRRAGLLSDYTFAVRSAGRDRQPGELLNVGKAYSGVTDAEIAELTEWLKAHTLEDYGHFRTVEPLRVIEVAFNNVMLSERHASGFALRFPRILRIRDDKPVAEIDTLERVEAIYEGQPDKPNARTEKGEGDKRITFGGNLAKLGGLE